MEGAMKIIFLLKYIENQKGIVSGQELEELLNIS